jgi:acetate kinase
MTRSVVALNVGSTNIKFAAFSIDAKGGVGALLYRGLVECCFGKVSFTLTDAAGKRVATGPAAIATEGKPLREQLLPLALAWVARHGRDHELQAVGHRVVHGGQGYPAATRLDAGLVADLEKLLPLDPPGLAQSLAAIRALAAATPDLAQVACFDSAFYRSGGAMQRTIALPGALKDLVAEGYGFHGLSYEYIAGVLPRFLGADAEKKVIVAHLGNEASMCALQQRRHVANAADFSAVEGLPMATRSGALDPGVILHLLDNYGMSLPQLAQLLCEESGLLGVSGVSGDMRELLQSADPHAREAIDLFIYRINREIGSLAAALEGLDALVFTGGIGEHVGALRAEVCRSAGWLGVTLDEAANLRGGPRISAAQSKTSAWVIPTDEESVIARHALDALRVTRR